MRLFRSAPHRVAVPVAHAMPFVNEIQMRVDLHHMDRVLIVKGIDAGDIDRVIAPEHDR